MIARQPDDAMLEIGDIDDEPSPGPELPPVVVIEYRDRGVPWMLIPPLLAAAVVVAVVSALTLNARWNERRPAVATIVPPVLVSSGSDTGLPTSPQSTLTPALVPDPVVVENPPPVPPATEFPAQAGDVPPMLAEATLPAPSEPTPPPAGPKVDALGFDPKALVDAPDPVAPVDRNVAVAQVGRGDEAIPGPAAEPGLPAEIDPALLPPDPTKSRFDRKQRDVRARQKLDQERFEFHAILMAMTRKMGRNAGPAIEQLCQEYGLEVPVASMEQAKKALGKTGLHAGARTAERITLLRQYGFPEAAILSDLVEIEARHEDAKKRDLLVRSAMVLLSHPPGRPTLRVKAAASVDEVARPGVGPNSTR